MTPAPEPPPPEAPVQPAAPEKPRGRPINQPPRQIQFSEIARPQNHGRPDPANNRVSGHQKRVIARERERSALQLRKAGASLDQIGQQLKVSAQAVSKMIRRALARLERHVDRSAEQMRALETERIDAMLLQCWQLMNDAATPADLRLQAIQTVARLQDRRAKMWGLDQLAPPPRQSPEAEARTLLMPALQAATTDELLQFRALLTVISTRKATDPDGKAQLPGPGADGPGAGPAGGPGGPGPVPGGAAA